MDGLWNIKDFGAVGDGYTDCTKAIQAAIDEAGKQEIGGGVYIPAGVYSTGKLTLHPHVRLYGETAWSIRNRGGSVLKLNDRDDACLLDITSCFGCTVTGIVLDGEKRGKSSSGILFKREDFFDHPEEDTIRIENCQIKNFTGAGIYLQYACAFSIRGCQIIGNAGDGLFLNSWDGFLLDNWFSDNEGWGIRCAEEGVNNAALTLTGNRVEWNHKGGFYLKNAKLWQITGNYFDRNGGPAVFVAPGTEVTPEMDPRWIKLSCHSITITGNIFNRSGADPDNAMEDLDSCHLRLGECFNVTVTGNTFLVGRNDDNSGKISPKYGMVLERLKGCIISQNNLYKGYLEKQILDMGGHGDQVLIESNVGCPVPDSDFSDTGNMLMHWE